MKKYLLIGFGLLFAAGAALAQTGGLGAISTWPGAFTTGGFIDFRGGPQSSVIRATGGTFTANGASAVTVTNANVTANSVIVIGLKTANTPGSMPFMATVTPGTGFTIKATAGDTSVYNYWILG